MSIVPPGAGHVVADEPERYAEIKVGVDDLALLEFRYGAGLRGPDPHVHHHHSDGFFVLEGELSLEIGPDAEVVSGGPGTFVLVPPDVRHTFRNESDADARFLNIHAPSCDFHRHMRGEDVAFDQHEPPADGGLPVSEVVMRRDGEGSLVERTELRAELVELSPGSPWPRGGWLYVLDGTLAGTLAGAGSLESRGHAPMRALHLIAPG